MDSANKQGKQGGPTTQPERSPPIIGRKSTVVRNPIWGRLIEDRGFGIADLTWRFYAQARGHGLRSDAAKIMSKVKNWSFVFAVALISSARGQGNWPQFRGPTGDGVASSTKPPLRWSETNNIAWKVQVIGRGRSSPVLLGERVWLTTAVEQGVRRTRIGSDDMQVAEHVSLRAVCLDRVKGTPLWEVTLFEVDKPDPVHWLSSWATPTPVVETGRVYFDFGTFGTACLEAETGRVIWKQQLRLDHQVGPGSSPVLCGQLLLLVRDGRDQQYVTALDKQTGQAVWKTNRPPIRTGSGDLRKSFSTPLLITLDGRIQIISSGAHWIVSYDPAAGAENWRVRHGDGFSIGSCPAFGHGLVFFSTGCFKPQLWAIRPDGQGDVTGTHVAWKTPRQVPVMSSPVLAGDEIYWVSDDGMACGADARTGQVHWQERLGGPHLASPISAAGRLYFFGQDGKTTVVKAGKQFERLAVNALDGAVTATPAFVGQAIYLRTDNHLYRIENAAGAPAENAPPSQNASAPPGASNLVASASSSRYAAEVLLDKPLAFLRFSDDSSGEGAPARDAAGAHRGAYHGGVSLQAGPPAIGGRAARFNGRDGWVDLPANADLDLDTLSVEFWFQSTQAWTQPFWPGSATFVSKATDGNGSSDWTIIAGSHEKAGTGCVLAGVGPKPGTDMTTPSPPRRNDGPWHHLVWTRTAAGQNRLYVDGSPAGRLTDSGGAIRNHRPIQIGGDPFLKGKFLAGLMAEVAIYGRVLTPERVAAHARAGGLTPGPSSQPPAPAETAAGWRKFEGNPVMGGKYGTCFDISVLKEETGYRMWLSWRPKASLALVESKDGVHWSEPPRIVLGPRKETGWEADINRPVVLKRGGVYHLWYSGFNNKGSAIGYATSADGVVWQRRSGQPVLAPDKPWEKNCLMCPHVLWDEAAGLFKMWYSGGERNEPDAIGYATSPDGLRWTKHAANPIFTPDRRSDWEKHKVTGGQVEQRGGWYLMFYIGFRDEPTAQIGLARSKDGVTNWQRHPANPIIRPGQDQWDHDACYKPYAIFDGQKWLLWYNGRHGSLEQIGVVLRDGADLGFGGE
jgi:outer membrane protein assembly factor BamB/predicted GH43/DUF377 family glycosyl hydrolase